MITLPQKLKVFDFSWGSQGQFAQKVTRLRFLRAGAVPPPHTQSPIGADVEHTGNLIRVLAKRMGQWADGQAISSLPF